ncbi:MAG: hypothetical protein ACPGVT_10045 [Maricaulaceae bacterium]
MAFITAPANAATTQQQRQIVTKITLAGMNGAQVSTLDWRQPKAQLRFDLMESEWTDGLELNLSMDPEGNVQRNTPIHVQFNNEEPIVLRGQKSAFDARIRLSESYVRNSGNIITISIFNDENETCKTFHDGSWNINYAKSYVTIKSRSKNRSFHIGEIETRLSSPTTAPKTVAIHAVGPEKARLEMLAAQSIALRMETIPNFRTTQGKADMQLILAPRSKLGRFINDKKITSDSGAKISIVKGRPLRLVITGDTDEQVLEMTKRFASHHLPNRRRNHTNVVEVMSQARFATQKTFLSKRTLLSDLNFNSSFGNWSQAPHELTFDTQDPSALNGQLMLDINASEVISPKSRLYVHLNGAALGYAALDKENKSVAFKIPSSTLKGTGNTLSIRPDLFPKESYQANSCIALNTAPGLSIKSTSYIELSTKTASPFSDLSRLTAGSDPFSHLAGKNTHVVLTSKEGKNLYGSLRVLGKLAQTKGTSWTEALVTYENTASARPHKFIIGPHNAASSILEQPPKSLQAALRGKRLAHSTSKEPRIAKFASNDLKTTMEIYAAVQKQANTDHRGLQQSIKGGVAAIYPVAPGRLIGVITATAGQSFSSASNHLIKAGQWNKLTGGVAGWNYKSVLETQIAFPVVLSDMPVVKQRTQFTPPTFNMSGAVHILSLCKASFSTFLQNISVYISNMWAKLSSNAKGNTPTVNVHKATNNIDTTRTHIVPPPGYRDINARTQLYKMRLKESLTPVETKWNSAIGFQQNSMDQTAIWTSKPFGKNGLQVIAALIIFILLLGITKPRSKRNTRNI